MLTNVNKIIDYQMVENPNSSGLISKFKDLFLKALHEPWSSFLIEEKVTGRRLILNSFSQHFPDYYGQLPGCSTYSGLASFAVSTSFKEIGKMRIFKVTNCIGCLSIKNSALALWQASILL